jgi:hypothetical protein
MLSNQHFGTSFLLRLFDVWSLRSFYVQSLRLFDVNYLGVVLCQTTNIAYTFLPPQPAG